MLGVEQRDGTRFYVEPTSAFRPVVLVRTPGLGRDRTPAGPPAAASRLPASRSATERARACASP